MSSEKLSKAEMVLWMHEMQQKPGIFNRAVKNVQTRVNNFIPEKIHQFVTKAIKEMTKGVLFGAGFTTRQQIGEATFELNEARIKERIKFYSSSAGAEGAITGFGGILLGFADFPLWLTLKMKMLFEVASLYGMDLNNLQERIYILKIFEITFSSQANRNKVFKEMQAWNDVKADIPIDINDLDWRSFQLEYRDHIDLAKLLQLIPGVGAIVGAFVNHRLTKKLGYYAMNAYRMRLLEN